MLITRRKTTTRADYFGHSSGDSSGDCIMMDRLDSSRHPWSCAALFSDSIPTGSFAVWRLWCNPLVLAVNCLAPNSAISSATILTNHGTS
jgi:hypothetical protein